MAYISRRLREQVTQRAKGLCEYCQTAQTTVVEMAIDHIIPEKAGGQTILDNLCLACIGCNTYKRDFLKGIDPATGAVESLFNPRREKWNKHFIWNNDGTELIGLTSVGRATIARLRINRKGMVPAREQWVSAGWHPPKEQNN